MDRKTYFVVKPKLRGYALIIGIIMFLAAIQTIYFLNGDLPLYLILDVIAVVLSLFIGFRMLSLSFYTYKITDTYVEKSRRFITDSVHKMPLRRIQSYEINSSLLDKLAGTTTVILKHGARDKPTLSLHCVGNEYIDGIENTIELIIKKDIKGPKDFVVDDGRGN